MVDKSIKDIYITSDNNKIVYCYEIIISVLAIIAVATTVIQSSNIVIKAIDSIVLTVFILDYTIRLLLSHNKRVFLRENILDLIAIFPFNSFFRVFRVARLIRLLKLTKAVKVFRVFSFSKIFHKNMKSFLKTNGFIYMIYTTIAIIVFGSVSIYIIEKGNVIHSIQDAVWLSFSSLTQFGYEGVELMSLPGKIIVAALVVTGICFTGMFTATAATYFIKYRKSQQTIQNKTIDLSDLSEEQYKEVINFINYTRTKS